MKMIKRSLRLIWICVILLCSNISIGQNHKIDSLENLLNNHPEIDTVRVNLLNDISYELIFTGDDKPYKYLQESLEISDNLNYKGGQARALNISGTLNGFRSNHEDGIRSYENSIEVFKSIHDKSINDFKGMAGSYQGLGVIYSIIGNYKEALDNFELSLSIFEKYNDNKKITGVLNGIAVIYGKQAKFDLALKYLIRVLEIGEKHDDKANMALACGNIGSVYTQQGNYALAIEFHNRALYICDSIEGGTFSAVAGNTNSLGHIYMHQEEYNKALIKFQKSLTLYREQKNKSGEANVLMNIGSVHKLTENYSLAIEYYEKALVLNKSISNKNQITGCLTNLGGVAVSMEKYNQAKIYYDKALIVIKEFNDVEGLCNTYIGYSKIFKKQKKYKEAIVNANKAHELSKDAKLIRIEKNSYEMLYLIYSEINEYKKAYENHVKYKTLSDSLFNKENIQKITALEYEYAYHARLDSAKRIELELTNEVVQGDIYYEQSQRKMLYGVIGFLALVILLVIIISILRIRNVKSKSEQVLVEQKLLRSQMTPHFIFNSISVLQGIVSNKEYDKSEVYMSKFSKLLRRVLENSKDRTVKLTDELQVIENYLAIQNLGVDNLYDYKITVDENVNIEDVLVPPMIIQPFIENAIEHGFKNKGKDRKIELKLKFEGDDLVCSIEDNGVGINFYASNQSPERQSMSTAITAKRLKMLAKEFKVNTDVKIEDRSVFNEVGTLVTLMLPYRIV